MREYELVFIVQTDLDDNALKDVVEKVKSWITDNPVASLPRRTSGANVNWLI